MRAITDLLLMSTYLKLLSKSAWLHLYSFTLFQFNEGPNGEHLSKGGQGEAAGSEQLN